MKLAVIGAGSTYTPELVDGVISRHSAFPVNLLSLMDIDEERLSIVGTFVERMIKASGCRIRVDLHTVLPQALSGADFVVTQIRVGGQSWRDLDCKLAAKYGLVGQETTGFAGFAKSLRTIPAVLEVCRTMRECAPRAWLVNFTNPSGIVTEAVVRHGGVRVVGLCNVPINMKFDIADALGVPAEEITIDYVGLNHLSWVRKVFWRGEDITERAFAQASSSTQANISGSPVTPRLARALGMRPSPYLRYFYRTGEVLAEERASSRTRAETVMEVEAELLRLYSDVSLNKKPDALGRRGGAHYSAVAVEVMSSILGDTRSVQIVDVPHGGAVEGFPELAVMEIPAVIDGTGAHPIHIGKVEPEIRGVMQQVKAYEELTIEAAVSGSYDRALLALVNNPLVRDADLAEQLLDELIEAGRAALR
ncbi:MAG: 6-phospho-beta-glucosidase [Firmicutes bacterium]|jgi:6-phospho-beta-glucosidase|nr:6-phospho-beta-glucosidase [Bacillota bacterium]